MHAIWAAYVPEQKIENGILWEDDIPETLRAAVKAVHDTHEGNSESTTEDTPDTDALESENHQEPGKRVGHLRVIK